MWSLSEKHKDRGYFRILCILMTFLIVLFCCAFSSLDMSRAGTHERKEHDKDIESILFGDESYKKTHSSNAEKIQALEDAVYLCVDQFNGSGKKELKKLQERHVPGIPKSIKEIDFKDSSLHRRKTHKGWRLGDDKEAHWKKRQDILMNTVDSELFPDDGWPVISKIQRMILKGEKREKKRRENNPQIESFSAILYYIHIIGDHLEADNYSKLTNLAPLAHLNDTSNPGVIPDIIDYSDKLFKDQVNTRVFQSYLYKLQGLESKCNELTNLPGGINSEERYRMDYEYTQELKDILKDYIPGMLRQEKFFKEAFPENSD